MGILHDDIMSIDGATCNAKVSAQPHSLAFMLSKWLRSGMSSQTAIMEIQRLLAEIRIMDFKPDVIKEVINPLLYPKCAKKFELQQINERMFYYYIKETKYSKPIGFLIEL